MNGTCLADFIFTSAFEVNRPETAISSLVWKRFMMMKFRWQSQWKFLCQYLLDKKTFSPEIGSLTILATNPSLLNYHRGVS